MPELTVTAWVYGDEGYRPADQPLVSVPVERLSSTPETDRVNYPMVLSRAVDEAGGDAFVREYYGRPRTFSTPGTCCGRNVRDGGPGGAADVCGLGGDGVCQCPRDGFDAEDCSAEGDLVEGVELLDRLAARHSQVTRLTTRLSPRELTFDPRFVPDPTADEFTWWLRATTQRLSLAGCESDVVDQAAFERVKDAQQCTSTYCGPGTCAVTERGPGCDCEPGFVARTFTDLDGELSVTCVRRETAVDYEAGGLELPDACAGVDCGDGTCLDRGGFPACECSDGAAAIVDPDRLVAPCVPVSRTTGSPGAENFSTQLRDLDVCAPEPPSCGPDGWLVENDRIQTRGVECASSVPDASELEMPPAPRCGGDAGFGSGDDGCAVSQARGGASEGTVCVFVLGLLGLALRRRRAGRVPPGRAHPR
jgi:hypothetical protein